MSPNLSPTEREKKSWNQQVVEWEENTCGAKRNMTNDPLTKALEHTSCPRRPFIENFRPWIKD